MQAGEPGPGYRLAVFTYRLREPDMDDPASKEPDSRIREPAPIGMRIASAMQHLGVQGIPRNYELFYDALTGANAQLNADFWALGRNVTQENLDTLYEKYYENRDGHLLIERVQAVLDEKIRVVLETLKDEQNSTAAYGELLDSAVHDESEGAERAPEKFLNVIDTLVSATGSTLDRADQPLSAIMENLSELESLRSTLDEYKQLAETDPLTGVYNRRAFDDQLAHIATAKTDTAALLIIDIDHFKTINDSYGHPFGDVVIRDVARLIRFNVRDDIFVARAGGEEFAVLLPGVRAAAAIAVAKRLCSAVENSEFSHDEIEVPSGQITVSVGVCSMPPAGSGADLYMKADQALYLSKKNGRNRVTLFEADDEPAIDNWRNHDAAHWL